MSDNVQVPNRLNYILWIQRLLDTSGFASEDIVQGLDIGIGASCIYSLLACRCRENWRMCGTEIDTLSFETAKFNVENNRLSGKIRLVLVHKSTPILANVFDYEKCARMIFKGFAKFERLHFVMCNPPFFASLGEMEDNAEAKKLPPFSAVTGTVTEMVTPGGEVAFISQMISESLEHKTRVSWYTTMIGNLTSVGVLVDKLHTHKVRRIKISTLLMPMVD